MTPSETTVHTILMGAHFRTAEDKAHLYTLETGDHLTLIAEPSNPYDNNAIAVYHDNFHLGYIQREVAANTDIETVKDKSCTILGFQDPNKPVLEFTILEPADADAEAQV